MADNPFDQFDDAPASQPTGNPFDAFDDAPVPVRARAPQPVAQEDDRDLVSGFNRMASDLGTWAARTGEETFTALGAGEAQALREGVQAKQAFQREPLTPAHTDGQDYEQPMEWMDLIQPGKAIPKMAYGLGRSAPSIAGGIAGGLAASAPLGGPESPWGAIAAIGGGAAGAGAVTFAQSMGPFYAEELKKTPSDPDGAFDRAGVRAQDEGAISGAAWAAFGIPVFKEPIKQILFQAFVGQPATMSAGREIANVREGRPVPEGVAEAIPGAVAMTAIPALGHEAIRALGPSKGQPKPGAAPEAPRPAPEPPPQPGGNPFDAFDLPADAIVAPPKKTPAERIGLGTPGVLNQGDGSPSAPIRVQSEAALALARERIKPPSEAQKESGNYPKGHITYAGFDVAIETPRGGTRSGTDSNGRPWSVEMPVDYGYIKGTKGNDGDHVDAYLGPKPEAPDVYVIDQVHADTGKFDEHKAFLGFENPFDAIEAYNAAFSDGRAHDRIGAITPVPREEFRAWAERPGARRRPLGDIGQKISRAPDIRPWEREGTLPRQERRPLLTVKPEERAAVEARTRARTQRPRTVRLADWLRRQGGVQDPGGELRDRGAHRLINERGLRLEDAATMAQEEGYLRRTRDAEGYTHKEDLINELLDALSDDVSGKPVFSRQDDIRREERRARERAREERRRDDSPGDRRVLSGQPWEGEGIPFRAAGPEVSRRDPRIMRQGAGEERNLVGEGRAFYSELQRGIEKLDLKRAPGSQWLNTLKNRPGIKITEIEDTGLGQWLEENRDRAVTREEVLAHMRDNAVRLEETTLGADENIVNTGIRTPEEAIAWLKKNGVADPQEAWGYEHPEDYVALVRNQIADLDGILDQHERDLGNPQSAKDVAEALADGAVEFEGFMDEVIWDRIVQRRAAAPRGWESTGGGTRFEEYTLPGGKNYRELLLKLPTERKALNLWTVFRPDGITDGNYSSEASARTRANDLGGTFIPARSQEVETGFRSSHWTDLNVLAHTRISDRIDVDGKRVLHVEEIQSDLHQAGRKKGYKLPTREAAKLEARRLELETLGGEMRARGEEIPEAVKAEWADVMNRLQPHSAARVPDAPFKKTWHELMLKRLVRYAAEHGYDRIAWTPGEHQAARYDISKHVDQVRYIPETKTLIASKDGRDVMTKSPVEAKDVPDYIGKDAAENLFKAPLKRADEMHLPQHELKGDGLKFGGRGMRQFYDKIVPEYLSKYGKKFGAKVGRVRVNGDPRIIELRDPSGRVVDTTDNDGLGRSVFETRAKKIGGTIEPETLDLHSMDVTPAMREAAMRGQPLFQKGGVEGEVLPAVKELARFGDESYTRRDLSPKERVRHDKLIAAVNDVLKQVAPHAKAFPFAELYYHRTQSKVQPIHGLALRHLLLYALEGASKHHDPVSTVRHEALHALKTAGLFTEAEWRALERGVKDRGLIAKLKEDGFDIERWYEGQPEATRVEEAIAETFGRGRPDLFRGYPEYMRGPLMKLHRFFVRLGGAIRKVFGREPSFNEVMDLIERGEIGARHGAREREADGMIQRQAGEEGRVYSRGDLERMDIDDLDRMAFGHVTGDRLNLKPSQIKIKYKGDLINPEDRFAREGMLWARSVRFDEPAQVSIGRDGKFYLEDGHHRWFAAKKLGRELPVEISKIDGKPIEVILARQGAPRRQASGEEREVEPPGGFKPERLDAIRRQTAGPEVPDDPRKVPPSLRQRTINMIPEKARAIGLAVYEDLQMWAVPMASGTPATRATAKDFANAMRLARWHAAEVIKNYSGMFSRHEMTRMWLAADDQSVGMQRGNLPEGTGLAVLTPKERAGVEALQRDANAAWKAAQDVGLVEGDGLPSYVPRILSEITQGNETRIKTGSGDGGVPGLDMLGTNLKTTSPHLRQRKYLTTEETETAAKTKFDGNARVIRDIRTLPLATLSLREAVAGRALVNDIKDIGRQTGEDTVVEGYEPNDGNRWFTIDHPSLKTWKPRTKFNEETKTYDMVRDENGDLVFDRVPIFIRGDFEGPLRAILSKRPGKFYSAVMDLKGRAMTAIMYSPLIHNAVEWGRALPAMPGKVATFRIYTEGNAARRGLKYTGMLPHLMGRHVNGAKDLTLMHQAIQDGMAPIGHGGQWSDITGEITMPDLKPGRSWTAQIIGAVPGLYDRIAGTGAREAVLKGVDKAGDLWHNTLLWDRVADLQMGLYTNLREKMIHKGFDPVTAGRTAAHLANRYAGALPIESMSDQARKIANVMMFSRSFTLGNIGAIKDIFTGLPRDVAAQIERDAGVANLKKIRSYAKRKALGIIAVDIALMYAANSILQSALNVLSDRKDMDEEAQGYADRFAHEARRVKESPLELLNPFGVLEGLTVNSENEPGREARIFVGFDNDGTAVYARNPAGKLGEEFEGWITNPLDMIVKKLSTTVRPAMDVINNDRGFGRKVYDPYAETVPAWVENVGKIVWHFMEAQVPGPSIEAAYEIATDPKAESSEWFKVFGPLAGVTFSRGAPGGPAVGEMYRLSDKQQIKLQAVLPHARERIKDGNIAEARRMLEEIGVPPQLIAYYIRTTLNPSLRLSGKKLREFNQQASPEEKERMQRYLQEQP